MSVTHCAQRSVPNREWKSEEIRNSATHAAQVRSDDLPICGFQPGLASQAEAAMREGKNLASRFTPSPLKSDGLPRLAAGRRSAMCASRRSLIVRFASCRQVGLLRRIRPSVSSIGLSRFELL